MDFFKKKYSTDTGSTQIENMFILNQLFEAKGDYVKVYLFVQYCAQNLINPDFIQMEKSLNLSKSQIEEALEYWQAVNLIRISGSSVELASLNAVYIQRIQAGSAYRNAPPQDGEYMDSFISKNSSPDFSSMLHRCEDLMGREILTDQRIKILDLIETFKLDYSIVEKAFSYTAGKNISQPNYAVSTLGSWAEKGYKSETDVVAVETADRQNEKFYKEIYKSIGITGRCISNADRNVMNSWINELGCSCEFIHAAVDNAVLKTTNPNFAYLDKVIRNLHKNGIGDVESLNSYIEKRSRTSRTPASPPKSGKSSSAAYTNEELEKILLYNKRK